MLTVRDIPTISGLEQIQIRASINSADKAIRWPYIAEDHELTPWLVGGEVIFITGINRSWQDERFLRLLKVTQEKNVAAIVVLTGSTYIPTLDPHWIQWANDYQIPLLEQPYSLPMVTVTERLSNAIVQDSFANRSQQWFLMQLIESPSLPAAITLEQARENGFPTEIPLNVAMLLPNVTPNHNIESWQFALREFLASQHSPFPLVEYRRGWLLLLPETTAEAEGDPLQYWQLLHQDLQQKQLSASIGVSNGQTLNHLNRLAFQARQCAEFIDRHYQGQLFHHKAFALQQLFAAVDDHQLLHDFCHHTLGPLYQSREADLIQVKQTLRHYFLNLCSVRRTAQQMQIHRNTVTSRLLKFEQLTHLSLADADNRLTVQNALLIESFVLPQDESS
ncbi:PucR family transcriptional regulator [Celerinatantimonas sp. YJH-8]|uniref:PucR family transcriptional regulator n=1 Tax=Celerinatantimonas sp. YJH-8 TaxID=3228714 RepID=UPI0038C61C39